MTAHSRGSHNLNNDGDDDVVLITESSSEDESQNILGTLSFIHGSSRDRRTIRELVREGRRLLALAEVQSRPEHYRNDAATMFRYNFSSDVTGCDLFRERDLAELIDIVSILKMRLSAERVFSLGCPQLRSERDVFDELLMRFSDELLDIQQGTHSVTASTESTSENVNTVTPTYPVGGASSSGVDGNIPRSNPITIAHLNSLSPSGSNVVSHGQTDLSERTVHEPQSLLHQRDAGVEQNTEVSTSLPQSENGQLLRDINISALQEFLKNVDELNSLSSLTSHAVSNKSCDPVLYTVFQSLHSTLSSVIQTSSSSSSLQQSELPSPRQGKRRRSDEGSSEAVKKSKTKTSEAKHDDEDKEEDSCSICLEPWTTGGDHRVTCLKCGHLFGKSCILKWIEQAHCCPQCKESAKKSDIRHIFVPKITAEDTSQRDRAMKLLEEERLARRNYEQKEAMARKKLEMQEADIDSLRAEINQLKAQHPENGRSYGQSQVVVSHRVVGSTSSSQPSNNKRFYQFQKVPISPEGQCRVFDYCRELGLLVASMKSTNALFRGYGIRILTRDFRPLSYQPLHSAAIRDMSFRPGTLDGMLLSCGLDKSLQLTCVTSQVVVQKYTLSSSAWCCAWNTQNTNLFYAGMERGVVKEFDIRRTDSHVQDVLDYGGSPISSIHYWNGLVNQASLQGLFIAHLQNLIFGEQSDGQLTTHQLPHLQAPLMSLSLHPSGMYMSSFRPGNHFPKSRYEICNLSQSNLGDDASKTVSSSCQAVWEGSNMQAVISRNSLITRPETEDSLLAVTANHSNNTVNIWDFNKKQDLQTLPCFDKAIDIKLLNDNLLGVLTDKNLLLYNWRA